MKKLLIMLVALLLGTVAAQADEAAEITEQAAFSVKKPKLLLDGDLATYWSGDVLEITLPEDAACHALYLSFFDTPPSLVVSVQAEGSWQRVCAQPQPYYNACVKLEEGATKLRLENARGESFSVSEIHLFGEGELPAWVQQWQPFTGKADLMVLAAHPDDELLFMGGTIPYYAGERGKKVIVVYMTFPRQKERYNELLDGLWHCGVREYPQLSPFRDVVTRDADAFVESLGGETVVMGYIVEVLRKYQPDVVVTHDRDGESGHGAHKAASRLMREGIHLAANASYQPAKGKPWQVKKLYLHLYKYNKVRMDWYQPLAAFGGKDAMTVATEAFECHVSQVKSGTDMGSGLRRDNSSFGLWYSAVGEDVEKNDFFENIVPQDAE